MNRAPGVSVCVPSFNYARFLQSCIDSVLRQSYTDFELIVVDDASHDESVRVIGANHDPRIRFVSHDERRGAIQTWNHCLAMARGDYVSFLCADDLFLSGKLQFQVAAFDANPSIGLVHADGFWADESATRECLFSTVFPDDLRTYLSEDHVSPAPQGLRLLAAGYNYIHLSNAMIRRDCIEDIGGFSPYFPYAADWYCWLRIAARHSVAYLARPLAVYRRHSRNLTRAMQRSGQDLLDWYGVTERVFRNWPDEAGDPAQVKRRAYRVTREHLEAKVQSSYASGHNRAVRRDLTTAFRHDPAAIQSVQNLSTYVKSLFGGRGTKRRLQQWLSCRSRRGERPNDGGMQ